MDKKDKLIEQMVQNIFATKDMEIHCEAASPLLIQSAEAQLSDEASQKQYPDLWQHFRFCRDCIREYRLLQDMMGLERAGELSYPTEAPPVPDWSEASPTSLKDVINRLFPGFPPALAGALTRGDDLGVEPVEMALDEQLSLELDIGIHENNRSARDLFGHLEVSGSDELEARLEGSPVQLLTGDDVVVGTETVDEFGDFTFLGISAGTYALHIQISGNTFIVSNIELV